MYIIIQYIQIQFKMKWQNSSATLLAPQFIKMQAKTQVQGQ